VFIKLPPLLMYLLAHVTELFLFLRYHFLLPFFLLFGVHPSLIPQWLGSAVFLQPALLDVQMIDLIIDDSRARKLLGCVDFSSLILNAQSVSDINHSGTSRRPFDTVSIKFNLGM
jgi:hypothetical protein